MTVPEPLLGHETLVGEWDPEVAGFVVAGSLPGPAGTAGVELPSGVTLDVDAAVPTRSCRLGIDTPAGGALFLPPTTRIAVRALIGEARLQALLGLAEPGVPSQSEILDTGLFGSGAPAAGTPRGVAPRLSRLALAVHAAGDAQIPGLARAVATLEAAALASDLDVLGFGSEPEAWAADGAERLLDLAHARSGLHRLSARAAGALAALLRGLARGPLIPWHALALARLAADLEVTARAEPAGGAPQELTEQRFALAMATDLLAEPPARASRMRAVPPPPQVDLDLDSVREAVDGKASVSVSVPSDCEIAVRLKAGRGATDGLWARAFCGNDLVALAPFQDGRRRPEAWLLITPGTASELVVDVTRHPEASRPSAVAFHLGLALDAGRQAARAARLGRIPDAKRHWEESARRWASAGDDRRHGVALGYATTPPRNDPLVSDHLVN